MSIAERRGGGKSPRRPAAKKPKLGQAGVSIVPIRSVCPSPENDRLYRPIDPADPDVKSLAASIRRRGILEPIVVSLDGFIISGHRRYAAALLAGLKEIPVRVVGIRRTDDLDKFIELLREHNRQREKSADEKLREELVSMDPDQAYQSLIEHREEASAVDDANTLDLGDRKARCRISKAKAPMLAAILTVIIALKKFWPLSDRRIHYALLNDPPLKHASKPDSAYANDAKSYDALTELLTRARLTGEIPEAAIADETRPVDTWEVYRTATPFIRRSLDRFLKGYWRDLMQSQPNHIELLAEKNTVAPVVRDVAAQYCIPLTSGRGYCSLPPRINMAKRFRKSGKERLILIIVSDFDPDGEMIASSFARSMRDDFGIEEITPIKAALTHAQVIERKLPPVMVAKETSAHYDRFVSLYGPNTFELEALEPGDLQAIVRETIDSVIDVEAFNSELRAEAADAAYLQGVRNVVKRLLADMDFAQDGDEEDE